MVKLVGAVCILGAGTWAWRRSAAERRRELDTLADLTALGDSLQGDEESVGKALTLAGKILEKNLAAARDHRQETEKRSAALWLSSAALLVILLI